MHRIRILELERAARDGNKVVSHLGIMLENANTNGLNSLKSQDGPYRWKLQGCVGPSVESKWSAGPPPPWARES